MRAHSSSCSISRADGADCGRSSGVADLAAAAAPRGTALPATLPTAGGCTAAEALDGRWILGPPPPGTRTEDLTAAALLAAFAAAMFAEVSGVRGMSRGRCGRGAVETGKPGIGGAPEPPAGRAACSGEVGRRMAPPTFLTTGCLSLRRELEPKAGYAAGLG